MNVNTAAKLDKLENVKILEHIQNYFKDLNRKNRDYEEKDSSLTQIAYESDIRLFFHLMRNKQKGSELEYLSMEDLMITQDDFEEYIEVLCELKNKDGNNKYLNKTINRKITALKGFIRYMKKKKVLGDLDISYLQLMKGEKERKNHYGALEPDEVIKLSDLAWETEKRKKELKRLLILFAFKTGLRIGEILSLKWNNIIKLNDEVIVRGIGKGNKEFEIKITNDLYEELLTINEGKDVIFPISVDSVSDMMERLRNLMGIQKERKIVFHSIRKAFGTLVWKMTGDIESARRALRHENIATTQIYLGTDNYQIQDVIFTVDKIDDTLYKKVNKEELINAISNCPKNVQLILNMKIQEILKQK
jgi:integrase